MFQFGELGALFGGLSPPKLLRVDGTGFRFRTRPITSLGHQGGEEFSESGPNFSNYVQCFQIMSNIFFQRGKKFSRGFAPLRPPGYGPV